jgi:hypothetical protein
MKLHVIEVTPAESAALCAAGKYRPGVPMFWVKGERTWAQVDDVWKAWHAKYEAGKEAKHEST